VVLDLPCREGVTGDYLELRSAVSNLVINALKYSADEQPVEVSWQRLGERLVLAVRDHGIGISTRSTCRD
jgi:two-component system phosphate regulon sensor histidine kinase PhoR